MDDFTRLAIAGGLIAAIVVGAIGWAAVAHRRRKRVRLRRRGIKTYGH